MTNAQAHREARRDAETYRTKLLLALRLLDVPAPFIAEALAEVDSHVTETGEDPRDAFGAPRAYAAELRAAYGDGFPSRPFWRDVVRWRTAAYGLAGAAGSWLLLDGVMAALLGTRSLGLPPWVAVALGLVVLAGLAGFLVRLVRRDDTRVLDPRTGRDMAPPLPRWVLPAMVAPPALAVAVAVLVAVVGPT